MKKIFYFFLVFISFSQVLARDVDFRYNYQFWMGQVKKIKYIDTKDLVKSKYIKSDKYGSIMSGVYLIYLQDVKYFANKNSIDCWTAFCWEKFIWTWSIQLNFEKKYKNLVLYSDPVISNRLNIPNTWDNVMIKSSFKSITGAQPILNALYHDYEKLFNKIKKKDINNIIPFSSMGILDCKKSRLILDQTPIKNLIDTTYVPSIQNIIRISPFHSKYKNKKETIRQLIFKTLIEKISICEEKDKKIKKSSKIKRENILDKKIIIFGFLMFLIILWSFKIIREK